MYYLGLKKYIAILFYLYCSFLVAGLVDAQEISREVAGLRLGMSFEDASKIFQMKEKEDGIVSLMQKFGFGNPEKQIDANKKTDKHVYEITGNYEDGPSSIEAFFGKGILYQIALHYGEDYIQKVDWDIFTSPAIAKYGQPIVSNNIQDTASFCYQWSDGMTRLEIAKGGHLSEDRNKFITIIYNVFYTDIKSGEYIQDAVKNELKRSTILPDF